MSVASEGNWWWDFTIAVLPNRVGLRWRTMEVTRRGPKAAIVGHAPSSLQVLRLRLRTARLSGKFGNDQMQQYFSETHLYLNGASAMKVPCLLELMSCLLELISCPIPSYIRGLAPGVGELL